MKLKKLRSTAIVPKYQSAGAAGMDIHADVSPSAYLTLESGHRMLVNTGISMEVPEGFEGQIRPRSGAALKHGVTVLNAPGTIDSDFRGEVKVLLFNASDTDVRIQQGDRIAQLVICPVARVEIEEVDALDETVRGAGGFGSTGTT